MSSSVTGRPARPRAKPAASAGVPGEGDDAALADGTHDNAPEWSVTTLAGALKRTLEDAFGHVRLRGEVTGYRGPHSSGHCYFGLKDESARIDAVIWKGVFQRLKIRPEEGMEVIATGKITTFPGSSKYQIVVESIEPAGAGALMAILEERRKRLAAEGLFDEARKRPLPFLPTVIGVVTSPTGAVIRDILHRLADRFPRHVLLWPVRVQGETSATEVAAAIRGFNALPAGGSVPRPDVLIVARGGGSLEDLWSFNEEIVVRAAAESDIPLVSAIGHETDWTLLDLAADLRAPTPTGAAEKVVPVRLDLLAQTADLARRHGQALRRLQERRTSDLRALTRALPTPDSLFAVRRQRLDLAGGRLSHALGAGLRRHEARLAISARKLALLSPGVLLERARSRLDTAGHRLEAAFGKAVSTRNSTLLKASSRLSPQTVRFRMSRGREQVVAASSRLTHAGAASLRVRKVHLDGLWKLVESLSHKGVLARGYALVRDEAQRPVRSAADVPVGMVLEIMFADGDVMAVAGGVPDGVVRKQMQPRSGGRKPKGEQQASLFDAAADDSREKGG